MARINIEDTVDLRLEYKQLVRLMGDEEKAMGRLVMWFRLAQHYFIKGEPIPKEKMVYFEHVVESGWAIEVEGGYQTIGYDNNFKWITQKVNSGRNGGLKSGKIRKASTRLKQTKNEAARSGDEAARSGANPLTLTLTLTQNKEPQLDQDLVVSTQPTDSHLPKTLTERSAGLAVADAPLPGREFVATYVQAFKARYGEQTRPTLDGKTLGLIKGLVKTVPLARAQALIQAYFQMEDPWFVTKSHDFVTFMSNLDKISVALDTGNQNGINWAKFLEKE